MAEVNNIFLLFGARIVRLFGYGFLSVILVFYLASAGFSEQAIGILFTLALLGDVVVSLWITTSADRIGRRRMLLLGAGLIAATGAALASVDNLALIAAAAVLGVISPGGNEIGPFLSIEQAGLAQLVEDRQRTRVFAWYNLAGSLATAAGALASGLLLQGVEQAGWPSSQGYRLILWIYAGLGLALAALFTGLSGRVEPATTFVAAPRRMGLHRSQAIVMRLSLLFALDAFAGGFVIQSIVAYWFHLRYAVAPALLGSIFFGANVLAGFSALLAGRLAARVGLINTMVFTHIPSNLLLMAVPLMPNLPLAITALLLRFSISQMDVPTRQSYTAAVVSPDERTAAAGITNIARSVGALLSPALSGVLLAAPALTSVPFFLAGGLKVIYDLLLFQSFRSIKPPEEELAHRR